MRLSRTPARVIALAGLLGAGGGCGGNIDLGSDLLWKAQFEGGVLDEWTGAPGGAVAVMPSPPGNVQVSSDHAHRGQDAARLFIDAEVGGGQQYAVLERQGELPEAAYYSAWYYLPSTVQVQGFWVIFKLRQRAVVNDPLTVRELFDVDLVNDAQGALTLQVYDHRVDAAIALQRQGLIVPVGAWFQIEAYYRAAPDATGALTLWFNGESIVDLEGAPTSPTSWVEWDVASVGKDLVPGAATLFADDCAVSRSRVGPGGRLGD